MRPITNYNLDTNMFCGPTGFTGNSNGYIGEKEMSYDEFDEIKPDPTIAQCVIEQVLQTAIDNELEEFSFKTVIDGSIISLDVCSKL
jgi:hypothetical protein